MSYQVTFDDGSTPAPPDPNQVTFDDGSTPASDSRPNQPDVTAAVSDTTDFADAGGTSHRQYRT